MEFKEQNKIELNDLWIVPIQTCTYIIQLHHPTKMATISQMANIFLHFQQQFSEIEFKAVNKRLPPLTCLGNLSLFLICIFIYTFLYHVKQYFP